MSVTFAPVLSNIRTPMSNILVKSKIRNVTKFLHVSVALFNKGRHGKDNYRFLQLFGEDDGIFEYICNILGARRGVVVMAVRYKPTGRGFDSLWCHWNFSVT
jgi:hypothetical protein